MSEALRQHGKVAAILVVFTAIAVTLLSSPKFAELMSQQRRIFDGTSGASYKNRKEDVRFTGLRTPWVMAVTPSSINRL